MFILVVTSLDVIFFITITIKRHDQNLCLPSNKCPTHHHTSHRTILWCKIDNPDIYHTGKTNQSPTPAPFHHFFRDKRGNFIMVISEPFPPRPSTQSEQPFSVYIKVSPKLPFRRDCQFSRLGGTHGIIEKEIPPTLINLNTL